MQSFESNNILKIYERNGKEVGLRTEEKMMVKTHNQNKDFVLIEVGEEKIAVSGNDLTRAIQNVRNAHKY